MRRLDKDIRSRTVLTISVEYSMEYVLKNSLQSQNRTLVKLEITSNGLFYFHSSRGLL